MHHLRWVIILARERDGKIQMATMIIPDDDHNDYHWPWWIIIVLRNIEIREAIRFSLMLRNESIRCDLQQQPKFSWLEKQLAWEFNVNFASRSRFLEPICLCARLFCCAMTNFRMSICARGHSFSRLLGRSACNWIGQMSFEFKSNDMLSSRLSNWNMWLCKVCISRQMSNRI